MSSVSPPSLPPDRQFSIVFGLIFAAIGAVGLYQGWGYGLWLPLFIASTVFLGLGLLRPNWLRPLNYAWYRLGMLLNRIVSPFVLGILFFCLLTPVALLTRLFGRDELRLKRSDAASYWISRDPPGPQGESFNNQY